MLKPVAVTLFHVRTSHRKFWHALTFVRGLVLEAAGEIVYIWCRFGDVNLTPYIGVHSVVYQSTRHSWRISVPLPHPMCTRSDR